MDLECIMSFEFRIHLCLKKSLNNSKFFFFFFGLTKHLNRLSDPGHLDQKNEYLKRCSNKEKSVKI